MNELICLSFGSTLLAIATFIFLWPRVRVLRLQNELLELRINAVEFYKNDQLPRSDFDEVDHVLSCAVDRAPIVTLSDFLDLIVDQKSNDSESHVPTHPLARKIAFQFSTRMTRYVCFETFSGMSLGFIFLILLGWRKLRSFTFDKHLAWVDRAFVARAPA